MYIQEKTVLSTSERIVASDMLRSCDLEDLFNGHILALRIHPFVDHQLCNEWQEKLQVSKSLTRYSNAVDVPVTRLGMTLFEAQNKSEKITQYLNIAEDALSVMRKVFGSLHPIQVLFSKLASAWSPGISIASMNGRSMNPGIIRSFESGHAGGLPPHVDSLLKDVPDQEEQFSQLKVQLAVNLYFSVACRGGALKVWNCEPTPDELHQMYNGTHDFLDTSKIPAQPKIMVPRVGELILFRSTCIHAVRPSIGGTRSAASFFLGYSGEDQPLMVWA